MVYQPGGFEELLHGGDFLGDGGGGGAQGDEAEI